jgi:CRP-like cAMP-binding protein
MLPRGGTERPHRPEDFFSAPVGGTHYPQSVHRGADSPEAYLIEVGQAAVTIGRKGVATVGQGDVVGERGPLLGVARAATVTAISHMITYAISRQRLRTLIEKNAVARDWMLAEMRRRYPNLAGAGSTVDS